MLAMARRTSRKIHCGWVPVVGRRQTDLPNPPPNPPPNLPPILGPPLACSYTVSFAICSSVKVCFTELAALDQACFVGSADFFAISRRRSSTASRSLWLVRVVRFLPFVPRILKLLAIVVADHHVRRIGCAELIHLFGRKIDSLGRVRILQEHAIRANQ